MPRGKPTQQAQNAISALLKAGLRRSDFTVTTAIRRGCWGEAIIWISNPKAAAPIADQIAAEGYDVHVFWATTEPIKGKLLMVRVNATYKGAGKVVEHK